MSKHTGAHRYATESRSRGATAAASSVKAARAITCARSRAMCWVNVTPAAPLTVSQCVSAHEKSGAAVSLQNTIRTPIHQPQDNSKPRIRKPPHKKPTQLPKNQKSSQNACREHSAHEARSTRAQLRGVIPPCPSTPAAASVPTASPEAMSSDSYAATGAQWRASSGANAASARPAPPRAQATLACVSSSVAGATPSDGNTGRGSSPPSCTHEGGRV